MHLLITPALLLTDTEKATLSRHHTLCFLEDERMPICEQDLSFDPNEVEGVVCNFLFVHNAPDVFPNLKAVQLTSAGLDRVPVDLFRKRGVSLFNAGATYAVPMAEWALAKILELLKNSVDFYENGRRRGWQKQRRLRELSGLCAAIVGFGNVGRETAKRLRAFDVSIIAVDIVRPADGYDRYVDITRLDDALKTADIVVLTLPLTDATRGLINSERLAVMKEDAVLVNIARGEIVDETALTAVLHGGKLWGAALDVFATEPLPADHPLWDCPRLLLTPHNSFVGNGNHARLFALVQSNLEAWKS